MPKKMTLDLVALMKFFAPDLRLMNLSVDHIRRLDEAIDGLMVPAGPDYEDLMREALVMLTGLDVNTVANYYCVRRAAEALDSLIYQIGFTAGYGVAEAIRQERADHE